MDDTGAQLFFRVVSAAYERRSLGIGSHWPFEDWGRFLPETNTAVSLLDRSCTTASWWLAQGSRSGSESPGRRGEVPSSSSVEHHCEEPGGLLVAKKRGPEIGHAQPPEPRTHDASYAPNLRLRTLGARSWDAVVHTCSWPSRVVSDAAIVLVDRVGHYGYVSNRSVYRWPISVGLDEQGPVVDGDLDR